MRASKQRDFIEGVLNSDTEACIEWPFCRTTKGYGDTKLYGFRRAHRLTYAMANPGPLPEMVLHSCDNPSCVNPRHLRGGDAGLNEQDKKDRDRQTHGVEVITAKLTPEKVAYIRSTHRAGARYPSEHSSRAIAEAVGVSWPAVRKVLSGEHWARV